MQDDQQNSDFIRQQVRQARRSLSQQQQKNAALSLWRQFQSSPLFTHNQHIALYIANDGEIDPAILSRQLLNESRNLYLPCIATKDLLFAPFTAETPLSCNIYGIPEPIANNDQTIDILTLDLVLLPLVAFDLNGNRLGMGGGFYDRTFAFKQQSKSLGPKLVGLAHECQKVESLNNNSWDIPLDAVMTDQRYIELS